MKTYLYPMVVYFDAVDASYTSLFPDLNILASGTTVEDVYMASKSTLQSYVDLAAKLNQSCADATSFDMVSQLHKNRTVLLVDVQVNVGKGELKPVTNYSAFLAQIVE